VTRFSIVTVLHDSADELELLLDSLDRHLPGAAQVVAVDTDSDDAGPALARARGCDVVELGANPGFGAANNAGIRHARHDVTVLLNPDCELLDGGLAELTAAARHSRPALLAPCLLGRDGEQQRTAHPLPGTVGAFVPAVVHPPWLPRELRERSEPWRARRPRVTGWAIAACLAARTDVLRDLGPFDPAQFLFYEDLDLCLRARGRGVPTVFVPGVMLGHAGGHSTAAAYGGEPHDLLARRRDEVVRLRLGRRAAALDRLSQALTFATRAGARAALGRPRQRELEQFSAQRRTLR
jgi:GT2 family glycosyltransferase